MHGTDPWITRENIRRFRDQLKLEQNPQRRSTLEALLAEQEAKLPADDPDKVRKWRMKAEELRAVADQITNPSARDSLRRTADTYDKLASDAEARLAGQRTTPTEDAG